MELPVHRLTVRGLLELSIGSLVETEWKSGEDAPVANTPVDNGTYNYDPYIGDYDDLQAVGHEFYGIFSAHNFPDMGNFPHGVRYQRNVNFGTNQLLNVNGVTPVVPSIDPFFFHIRWHEEGEKKQEHRREETERLILRGLKYERLEIDEIELEFGNAEGKEHGHSDDDDLLRAGRTVRRLGERIEGLGKHLIGEAHEHEHHEREHHEHHEHHKH